MSTLFTRLELVGDHGDYEALHAWMEQAGFSRTILGTSGRSHLPPALYVIDREITAEALRDWLEKNVPWFGSTAAPRFIVITSVDWAGIMAVA